MQESMLEQLEILAHIVLMEIRLLQQVEVVLLPQMILKVLIIFVFFQHRQRLILITISMMKLDIIIV